MKMKAEEIKSHENVMQDLQYIEKSLLDDSYKEKLPILTVLLSEVYASVKAFDVEYKVPVSVHREHLQTFINLATQEKYRLLSDLQELNCELHKKNTNRSLQLVKHMLDSDLYKERVQESLDMFIPSSPVRYGSITEMIYSR
ncbi:hypothetical protein [Bacillus sp. NPDC077027]|uniref:hypothetical protein n=1 Tax=Bacillus sp. NPDC077027 TaxID=3390548 RepID=UPI003D01D208